MMKYRLIRILLRSLLSTVGIHLLFTPILCLCYWYTSLYTSASISIVVVNAIQFISIVFIGVFLSRKNSIELQSSRKLSIIFCALSGLFILPSFTNIHFVLYRTFTRSLDIFDSFYDNLFPIILLDQLLNNHLITSFLVCSAVIFFKPLEKRMRKSKAAPESNNVVA